MRNMIALKPSIPEARELRCRQKRLPCKLSNRLLLSVSKKPKNRKRLLWARATSCHPLRKSTRVSYSKALKTHAPMHFLQPMQASASTTGYSKPSSSPIIEIAPTGQTHRQAPHPQHSERSRYNSGRRSPLAAKTAGSKQMNRVSRCGRYPSPSNTDSPLR